MSSPVSSLETHLGYWLRFVSNHVSHGFKLKVEAQGVTVAEWVLLRTLFDTDSAHPSELAAQIGLTRGAVSKLVERLAAKRLLSCRPDKLDRRHLHVSLTEAGRSTVPVLAALADRNDQEFFDHLSTQQQADLSALLQSIVHRQGLKAVPVD
jgi:DNA-binding MarR family transcriptional regulator